MLQKYIQDENETDFFSKCALLLYAKAYYGPHIYFIYLLAHKLNFMSIRIYVSNKNFKLDVHRGRSGRRVKISVKQFFITKEREYFPMGDLTSCKREIAKLQE
jgi:hypothetical protein